MRFLILLLACLIFAAPISMVSAQQTEILPKPEFSKPEFSESVVPDANSIAPSIDDVA